MRKKTWARRIKSTLPSPRTPHPSGFAVARSQSGAPGYKAATAQLGPRAVSAAAMLVVGGWLGSSSGVWAANGSCSGTSPITVSTALTGTCSIESGDALTVTANGSIVTTTGSSAVEVSSIDSSASIQNAGSINGSSSGIEIVDSTINFLNNSGTIASGSDGIYINIGAIINTLTNSGTIEGDYSGISSYGNDTIHMLNNTGTIEGRFHAIYIDEGTLTTLNNSGSLIGLVETRNTEINLSGTSARIVGRVQNPGGSINLLSGADFTTEGRFEAATFSILENATLHIGSTAHRVQVSSGDAAAFRNAGTLHVAEGRVADVRGNYTQSGALRIGASSNISYGRLTVTGNAVLTSSATIAVDVNTSNTLANNQTLTGVITADGTLTNNAGSGYVSDNSALFDFEPTTNAQSVDLRVVAVGGPPANTPPLSPAPAPSPAAAPSPPPPSPHGIVPAVLQQGLINGAPAATVLDGYIRGGRTGSDWDTVVTALGRLPTNATVTTAVGQAMPAFHGNTGAAGLNHSASTGTAFDQQKALSGLSGGDGLQGRGLWVKPLGNWVDQDAVGGASGYKIDTQGLVGGVQSDLGVDSTVGLALAYIDSNVQGKGYASSHASDIESVQLTGYGQQALGQRMDGAGPWRLGWQAGHTRSRFDSHRTMGFIGRTAQAKFNADVWHLGLGLNRSFVRGATTVTPGVHLDWRQFKADAYTETGAGALSLDMQAQKAQETILKVGAQVQHGADHQLQWLASAALGYDLQSQDQVVSAQFSGGGAAFTTPGLPRARTVAELGVGLRYRPSEAMEVTARYDIALRKGMRDQTASVRLGWVF